jgi:ribosomal protein S18 acetylase RimI-like enzyme
MLLGKMELEIFGQEVSELYQTHLGETAKGLTHFGIINDDELWADGAIKCYMGSWYLRGCVVKPQYRGRGLQRELIRERLAYLTPITDLVRVSVYPENLPSRRNIEAEGFEFEKNKKLVNGDKVIVYRKSLYGRGC